MTTVFLSLGTNSGNRIFFINEMIKKLSAVLVGPVLSSTLMETKPLGMKNQKQWFLNVIIRARYKGSPARLLTECNRIENELGRKRKTYPCARTSDIDILLFGHSIVKSKNLIIPHPAIKERRFCLHGLNELAPNWKFPGTRDRILDILKKMKDDILQQEIIFL